MLPVSATMSTLATVSVTAPTLLAVKPLPALSLPTVKATALLPLHVPKLQVDPQQEDRRQEDRVKRKRVPLFDFESDIF